MIKSILLVLFFCLLHNTSYANEIGQVTGYKIPRFVSLKSDEVNLRIGSSTNYPIILKYITIQIMIMLHKYSTKVMVILLIICTMKI